MHFNNHNQFNYTTAITTTTTTITTTSTTNININTNLPSNSDGNSYLFQKEQFSTVSKLSEDLDCQFDSFFFSLPSTTKISSSPSIDFNFFENIHSHTVAEDINDFTDLLLQYEPNQFDISDIHSIDTPTILSPDIFPLIPSPSKQFSLDDYPEFSLPPPLSNEIKKSSPNQFPGSSSLENFFPHPYSLLLPQIKSLNDEYNIKKINELQIPKLPLTMNSNLFQNETERKKEYRRKKYLQYVQKKKFRNKQKLFDIDIRYHSRQTAASKRQRINGKFARECPVFIPANKF